MNHSRRQVTTTRVALDARQSVRVQVPGLRFRALSGPDSGRSWILSHEKIRIGSDPANDLVLGDPTVSRFHAVLEDQEKGLLLSDLDSRNGTFVEEVRIVTSFLKEGQRIRIGKTELRIQEDVADFTGLPVDGDRLGPLVGASASMKELFSLIAAAAPCPVTILITGESGTGKELFARQIHELSRRRGPFLPFDCGRRHNDLFSSELFGHVKGAFTGAESVRQGAFRSAHEGTLFLDEIGELPMELQPGLLRTLQTREVQPIGADQCFPVDVRLVSATNRNLRQAVEEGRFREDLYYRLNVIEFTIPPLRERREDIPRIVEHRLSELASPLELAPAALNALMSHSWPGNVRELGNCLERLSVVCRGRIATPQDLAFLDPSRGPGKGSGARPSGDPDALSLADQEREIILGTYERSGNNKKKTARTLGISLSTLKRKLQDYGVSEESDE